MPPPQHDPTSRVLAAAAHDAAGRRWRAPSHALRAAAIIGPTLVVLLVGTLSFVVLERAARAEDRIVRSHGIAISVERLRARLADAEAAQRTYVLSGAPAALDPLGDASADVWRLYGSLDGMIEQPAQRSRLVALRPLIAAHLAVLDTIVAARRTGGEAAAEAIEVRGRAGVLADSVRMRAAAMQSVQAALLHARYAEDRRRRELLTVVVVVGTALAALLALFVNALLARQAQRVRVAAIALRDSEARLSGMIGSALDAIVAADPARRVVLFNAAAERLFGLPAAAAVGRPLEEFLPMQRDDDGAQGGGHAAGSAPTRDPLVARRPDGAEIPVEVSVSEVPTPAGTFRTFILRDASERQRAERWLRESESRLRTLADSIPQLAWMTDARGAVLWLNRRYREYTGISTDDPRAAGWRDAVHPDHRERVGRSFDDALATGAPWEDTFPMRGQDGASRWFLSRALPLRDGDGTVESWFGTNTDVTTQLEAEEDQRFLLDLGAALQAARDPDAVAEVATRLVGGRLAVARCGWTTNDFARRTFTMAHEHRLRGGRSHAGTYPIDVWGDELLRALTRGETVVIGSTRDDPRTAGAFDAAYAPLGLRAALLVPLVREGRWVGTLTLSHDAPRDWTARDAALARAAAERAWPAFEAARLHREALAARADAESANRAKSTFLATMSHELRTPLNAVVGYTELVEMGIAGPVTEQQSQFLSRVRESARHLLGLISEVLDIAKIESGRMRTRALKAATADAVSAALALVRPQAAARRLEVAAVPGDRDAQPQYLGDPDRVRQVLLNLLSNAVKFTEPGGRVTVRTGESGSPPDGVQLVGAGPWVYVRVSDTGIGVPEGKHEAIFEPFRQVEAESHDGLRRTQGGTGLGLAISRQLARLMRGDVTYEPRASGGSAFTLWLPAAGTAPAPPPRDQPEGITTPRDVPAYLPAGGAAPPVERAFDDVGAVLGAASAEVVRRVVARLRDDPATPRARDASDAELEDHLEALVTDFAQHFTILDARAPGGQHVERAALLRDGVMIQQFIASHHGAQRFRLGWGESALRRQFTLLREVAEEVVRDSLAYRHDEGALDDALALAREFIDEICAQSLAGYAAAVRDLASADTR